MEREFECRVTEKSVSFPLAPNLSPRRSSQFQFVIIFPFLVDDEESFLRLYFRGELGPLSGISKQYHDGGGKKSSEKKHHMPFPILLALMNRSRRGERGKK